MLEYRRTHNKTAAVLTVCPACGHEFPQNSGKGRAAHYRNDHGPSDFGL